MELPFDPAIPLVGLYPKNPETPIQKNLHTPTLIAAQFTITKFWKQLKCPSVNECIKDEWIKIPCTFIHGIVHSRKKEGAPIIHDNMDGWNWRVFHLFKFKFY